MEVREMYTPLRMAASGTLVGHRGEVAGFLCTTSGTLQITAGTDPGGADIVSAFSVTAGNYYPFGFRCATGAYAVLTTAVGTFTVA